MGTTINIKKGWVVKKTKDKDGETIVATKKFFEPKKNGYSAGSIEYSASYHTTKGKKKTDEVLEENIEEDL